MQHAVTVPADEQDEPFQRLIASSEDDAHVGAGAAASIPLFICQQGLGVVHNNADFMGSGQDEAGFEHLCWGWRGRNERGPCVLPPFVAVCLTINGLAALGLSPLIVVIWALKSTSLVWYVSISLP